VREAGEVQAGGKCAERKENAAHERFLPQAEDSEEMMHNPFRVRRGRGAGPLRAQEYPQKIMLAAQELR
jgi:hypothetical protein